MDIERFFLVCYLQFMAVGTILVCKTESNRDDRLQMTVQPRSNLNPGRATVPLSLLEAFITV